MRRSVYACLASYSGGNIAERTIDLDQYVDPEVTITLVEWTTDEVSWVSIPTYLYSPVFILKTSIEMVINMI